MSNLAVLPILMPLIAGILVAFIHKKTTLVRNISKGLAIINLVIVGLVFMQVRDQGSIVLEMGSWEAPFGIVLVGDLLAMTLVLTTNIIAVACVFFAPQSLSEKEESYYFYSFFFLLISGVSGAFLTGDLFNLFVFFEVLLMASYGLIVLGNGKAQLRESIKYVLINLFSSMLFVTTIAFLYSVVGTVNMAQAAQRVQEVEQQGILTTIAILFFFVFATKAAVFPLYYWLPRPYISPNPVVSALFGALLTKVGIYSILRTFSLIFNHEVGLTHTLFIYLAAFTMIFGVVGAISTNNIKLIVAYNIIPAVGFMLMGIGIFTEVSISGTVYYLVHDMVIKGVLFLLVGATAYVAGTSDLRKMGGLIHHYPVLGWLLFIASLVLAGIPPFSGFMGKLQLLRGGLGEEEIFIVIIGLVSSLLILFSMIRIFIRGFWGEKMDIPIPERKKTGNLMVLPAAGLLTVSVLLGVGAEWFFPTIESISQYLMDPEIYIDSVIKE
ncbi:multisubunit sodium/proton antiporter, MrpD subunit [Halobacillus karajensis]|uniref:Multiple resistance and pH homeostasis protein D n=1 Tax=Halobacillus karajensis TaxID=195088 RepID=A0A024P6Y7_9BACI|nr:Na+/H+ antiporter subunit D [Halobacillus karajensis]CDQ18075.1 Multiple resistance and pH homeostasis protein D [Halobacillus karajensis]CDQ24426.1 Multiple resistance and pH homeostasis protein D [Halobacillus karajensis]CDQ29326.1 Multiple resistance and pH homeostasis protein D [Halobacillus karajensis]SEH59750.1 multisubunit sodium/proton antiporter, MrpD subunit [Halobacillus karajensis]